MENFEDIRKGSEPYNYKVEKIKKNFEDSKSLLDLDFHLGKIEHSIENLNFLVEEIKSGWNSSNPDFPFNLEKMKKESNDIFDRLLVLLSENRSDLEEKKD